MWGEASKMLEEERRRELLAADHIAFVRQTSGMVRYSLRHHPQPATSGLIEQQAIFHRRRK
jgi:hypothetical protein